MASIPGKRINPKHLTEWVEGSAVNEAIAKLNIESLPAKEINQRVRPRVPVKTGGWWCRGVNWQTGEWMETRYGQVKPDKAHQPEGSSECKYLTSSGMKPDAIFLAMPDKDHWAKVHADKSIPRHWAEGVKKAGAGLSLGLAVIALTGVWNWGKGGNLAKFVEEWAQPGTVHYIDFDSDYAAKPSCRAAIKKFAQLLIERGCTVHITCWDSDFKGLDDYIVGKGGNAFLEAVAKASAFAEWEKQVKKSKNQTKTLDTNSSSSTHPRIREGVVCLSSNSSEDYIPDTAPVAGQNFILKAEDALYSDGHYVSIGEVLYRFTGSYYEELNESKEKRRIGGWLKTYSEMVKGAWVKNRADTASVNAVFNWVVNQSAVAPEEVNVCGLNCSNGVVRVNSDGSHILVPHSPDKIYTYVGCKYDPNINPTYCYRLLECLEPSQREIFLRTAAAALDLKLVRSKLTGRGVKGLLCHGEGSNGKDTLRAVLAAVYGKGMTGKSLSDFKSYDMGRKFTLAGIEGSICNWASENTSKVDLDNIQSLKQVITGDPIDIERKGKDSYEYKPIATFFANCNKLPSITGGTEAIDGRYGILRFDKTYARNAIASEGQLEADPRFKDDEKFVLEQIAPAMLNMMLERMPLLLTEGIDYKATNEAMQKAQEESRHLWQFAREAGLDVQAGGRVWLTDLWDLLVDWYEDMGILDKEYNDKGREKLIWNELPNKYDSPVKAINQVASRFSEIFPKLQVCRYCERDDMERRNQRYLLGIGFVQSSTKTVKTAEPSEPVYTARDTAEPTAEPQITGSAVGSAETLTQSGGSNGSAVYPHFIHGSAAIAKTALPSLPVDAARDTALPPSLPKNIGSAVGNAETLTQSAGNDGNAVYSPLTEFCALLSKLTADERQKMADFLTGVPCSDPIKAFRVGDKVAGNKPEDSSYNWHGRIVELTTSISCRVDWQEREDMRGGRVISMLFCNLRKI